MRVLIVDIDKLILFLKTQQMDDLAKKLVDFQNKTIDRLLFKILIKWLLAGAPIPAAFYCAFYYFDHPAYGNIIKLYFVNDG